MSPIPTASTSHHHPELGCLGSQGKKLTLWLRSLLHTIHWYQSLKIITSCLLQSGCKANAHIYCQLDTWITQALKQPCDYLWAMKYASQHAPVSQRQSQHADWPPEASHPPPPAEKDWGTHIDVETLIANFDASFQYSKTLMKMCARLTEAIRKKGLLFHSKQTLPLIALIYNTFLFSKSENTEIEHSTLQHIPSNYLCRKMRTIVWDKSQCPWLMESHKKQKNASRLVFSATTLCVGFLNPLWPSRKVSFQTIVSDMK